MSDWQRVYRARGAHPFPRIFVGCVLGALGLVLGFLFFPWGFALWALAIGVPIAMAYFGTDTTIVAGPGGFSVTTESKRSGRQDAQYGWQEVTATHYEEFTSSGSESGRRTTRYFAVDTGRGRAFRVDDGIGQFDDLIQVFNHSTPQLPYVWQKQGGFNVTLGPVSAGRQDYVQVQRQ